MKTILKSTSWDAKKERTEKSNCQVFPDQMRYFLRFYLDLERQFMLDSYSIKCYVYFINDREMKSFTNSLDSKIET